MITRKCRIFFKHVYLDNKHIKIVVASNSSRVSMGLHKISASLEAVAQPPSIFGSFSYFQSRFP